MVIVMDMSTGTMLEQTECYGEEIVNAGWLPMPALGLQTYAEAERATISRRPPPLDTEAFLRAIYLNQE